MFVKTRFAPSPTGFLHIGGARTALFSYLFARQNHGKFVLRIEDTDKERSEEKYATDIIESMKWLGLQWDEGPFYQSARLPIYQGLRDTLLNSNKAYEKDGAVFFRAEKDRSIVFDDIILGRIEFSTDELEDFVIIKSDGNPSFHFAVVADDISMGITHIIRGNDHISNTPKQILLFEALQKPVPQYAHLPLIVGADQAPLSKRHGATAVSEYRKQDFLPEALINFLARMGWGYKDQELFSITDLVNLFDLYKVNKAAAVFNMDKLLWLNGQHLKKAPADTIYEHIKDRTSADKSTCLPIIELFRPKVSNLAELVEGIKYLTAQEYTFEPAVLTEQLASPDNNVLLEEIRKTLHGTSWNKASLEQIIRGLAERKGLKAAQLIHPLRAAVTGKKTTPGIFELLEVLGREKTLKRLANKKWLA